MYNGRQRLSYMKVLKIEIAVWRAANPLLICYASFVDDMSIL